MSSFAPLWPLSSVLQRQYGCPSSSAEVGRLTDSKTSLAERTAVATADFLGFPLRGLPFLLFSQVFEVDSGQGIINRQWPENTTSGNGKNIKILTSYHCYLIRLITFATWTMYSSPL